MYLDYFKFDEHPFQMAPDEEFLFLSLQHTRALVYMDYAVWDPAGFVVITGAVGAGKTTLVKRMLKNLDDSIFCLNLSYTILQGGELFRILLKQVTNNNIPENKIDMLYLLQDFLVEKRKREVPVILLIDEAQYLSIENLEDIRLLAGLENREGPLLRLILLGQPELQNHIASVPQLSQRVKLHYQLNPLTLDETEQYIAFRLAAVGCKKNTLFSKKLCSEIHKVSNGTPRLINKTCDALLMCAFADDRQIALEEDLEMMMEDLMLNSIPASSDNRSSFNNKADFSSTPFLKSDASKLGFEINEDVTLRLLLAVEGIQSSLAKLTSTQVDIPVVHKETLKPIKSTESVFNKSGKNKTANKH